MHNSTFKCQTAKASFVLGDHPNIFCAIKSDVARFGLKAVQCRSDFFMHDSRDILDKSRVSGSNYYASKRSFKLTWNK